MYIFACWNGPCRQVDVKYVYRGKEENGHFFFFNDVPKSKKLG